MPKKNPAVTVSILAHNPTTNRVERVIHLGRVPSPATAREILRLTRRALRERTARIAF